MICGRKVDHLKLAIALSINSSLEKMQPISVKAMATGIGCIKGNFQVR